ncbi:MAG: glucokinase [Pseudomonadales bacterium]|nr:glucokinase [Pseudomonadales bacterium]NIX07817.1 glucokinase [Pseudomonadales bacterium]
MAERAYLVADIGGTNARLALSDGARLESRVMVASTASLNDVAGLAEAVRSAFDDPSLAGCCVAMAGPVHGNQGSMTNESLTVSGDALGAELGCPVRVVNDFYAMARGIPFLGHLHRIGPGEPRDGVRALIGPGSGLGMGVLVPMPGRPPLVLPSEGGHADLAPGSPLEQEVLQVLAARLAHVSWESVLSGPGLVNLYAALCAIWGVPEEELAPEEISRQGLAVEDPICHQVLELFFGFLGAAAGNLALTVCAEGGVYIGGGIVPQLVDFADSSPLRRRFEERGVLTDYAARLPLYIIEDEFPGLLGAVACLADQP